MWDDPEYVGLDSFAKEVWIYLLLGPEARVACPGLVRIGTGGLAEALRASGQDVHVALGRLEDINWLRVHAQQRIIHIPKAPVYRGRVNGRILKGWYRRWKLVPDGPWKQLHIKRMESCRPTSGDVWEKTFGSAEATAGKPLPMPGKALSGPGVSSSGNQRTFPLLVDKSSEYPLPTPGKASFPERCPEPSPEPSPDPDPSAEPAAAPEAERLWLVQEQLRADLGLPRLRATPGRIARVALALQQFSAEELEHVLRVFRRQACEDPAQADWLDGRRNWLPQCIEPRLGQSATPKARDVRFGRVEPKPTEDYGPPGVVENF